ncbi:MAG TPA: hypothetical protein DCS23_02370 [Candidatus Yonathbacteria bacterium]|nr:hypothetical protein [Candidatus Yonathbacteria bacterium]
MLETLRAKPNHIKQSVSLALTIVIFSAILFVWVSSRDARSREVEVREKTVTPVDGVSAMFDGFLAGLKERTSNALSPKKETPTSTSTDDFDLSGVVVIDQNATSTEK